MRISLIFTVLLVLATALTPVHDFHVSITTMKHDVAKDELHITLKLTTHDIEYALEQELGGIAHFGSDKETEAARTALKRYLLDRLTVVSEEETLDIVFVGKEVEYEDMYCYLQVSDFAKYKVLEVNNTILFDQSEIQSNVIHLENSRGIKTLTCTPDNPVVRFTP